MRETPRLSGLTYVAHSRARIFILISFALFNAERGSSSHGEVNRYFIFSQVQPHSFIVMRAREHAFNID